jgi:hypothetical protein
MQPYVDRSDNEISIHCLDKEDLALLEKASLELFNRLHRTSIDTDAKRRLKVLKNLLKNESLQP